MNVVEIPDIKYTLCEDKNLFTIELGFMGLVNVQLHRIHIKHFAQVMEIGMDQDEDSSMLVEFIEQISEQATKLFELLDAIPNLHPRDIESANLVMSKKPMFVANKALAYLGDN